MTGEGSETSDAPRDTSETGGTAINVFIDRLDYFVTQRPLYVIVVFLLLTLFFVGGMGQMTTETGTDDFTQDTPEADALEEVNENFESGFGENSGSTQLIQRGENVLSKKGVLRMLRAQHRLEDHDDLRVESTTSVARAVAQRLDPEATTLEDQLRVVEGATPSEVRESARNVVEQPGLDVLLSDDLNEREPYASATIGTVSHAIPEYDGASTQPSGSPLTPIQLQSESVVESVGGDIVVFGSGILGNEFDSVIGDSLNIVLPVVLILILLFLVVAYRDVIDLLLGLVALIMTIIWTFGFMGWTGIPFGQMMIALPVLLLAVGIDFGIHAVNRYKEERATGLGITESMDAATDQLLVAFFIVTGTAVIGFGSNITSGLGPIQDFGVATAAGMVFTFLIFGVFMPSAKLYLDGIREGSWIPEGPTKPLGGESGFGDVLAVGNVIADRNTVVFLVFALLLTAGAGVYATNMDTSFSDEDFLPPEELPGYIDYFPESLQPGEYTVTEKINFLEDNFESGQDDEVTLYVEGPLRQDFALESLERANQDPPETFLTDGLEARSRGILTVIESHAQQDEEFARLVARNDADGNGVPDSNVGEVLNYLLSSESRGQALNYLNEDLRSTRIVYSVESDAGPAEVSARAAEMAEGFRLKATPTGQIVVQNSVIDIIFESAILALIIALVFTALFLVVVYHVLEERASLGIANLVPIVVAVVFLAGTMPVLGIPLNALTATILSIAVGIGIAYSVHITHRFIDEYNRHPDVSDAISTTLRGTGGALTGSMLTTAGGTGALALAITPVLGQFGLLMAISVVYSYITSMVVLPSTLVVWSRYFG
ncbi:MAG: MMPL family transporter [Halobacteriales archaeon]|nr:MMPL family transporter [Halobacteriales archaeon]